MDDVGVVIWMLTSAAAALDVSLVDGDTAATGSAVVARSVPPTSSASELATTDLRGRHLIGTHDAKVLNVRDEEAMIEFRCCLMVSREFGWLPWGCPGTFFIQEIFRNQNHRAPYEISTLPQLSSRRCQRSDHRPR